MNGTISEGCESIHTIQSYRDQDTSTNSNNITTEFSNETAVEVMGDSDKLRPGNASGKDRKKHSSDPGFIVKQNLTNVAHCCILAFVLLIWYICFTHPFVFFTWHPLLLSLGWMFLMIEAVLVISKENVISKKLKLNHTLKERYHWIFLTIGGVLIATGFLVITISKNNQNKNHYTSWHGLFGLIGIIAYIPPCINGIPLLYRRELKDYIKPSIVKFIHIVGGVVSLTFGGMSLILSVYTKWFARNTNNSSFVFYYALLIATFPMVWATQRPLLKCWRSMYNVVTGNKDHKRPAENKHKH